VLQKLKFIPTPFVATLKERVAFIRAVAALP
jgi:hypothetical protein